VSNSYDSDNVKDNEKRKFQADELGDVAVNVIDKEAHDKLDAISVAIGGTSTNLRSQILAAPDRLQVIVYLDFGNKNQRVDRIDYSSLSVPGVIARKRFTYSLVGNRYRRDTIVWEIL
jgi:hypothetical protein